MFSYALILCSMDDSCVHIMAPQEAMESGACRAFVSKDHHFGLPGGVLPLQFVLT